MGIKYSNIRPQNLRQIASVSTIVAWVSPPEGSLSNFSGGDTFNFEPTIHVTNSKGLIVTFAVQSGTIPAGTSLDVLTGIISGTLDNTTASYDFVIRATCGSIFADREFTTNVTAVAAPVWVTSANLGSAYELTAYNYALQASDPQSRNLSYSLVTGVLPSGISLSNTGVLSGTFDAVGGDTRYSFTVKANNGVMSANRAFSFQVKQNLAPSWDTTGLGQIIPQDTQTYLLDDVYGGDTADYVLTATNYQSDETLTYTLSGTLPAGLSYTSNTNGFYITGTFTVVANTVYDKFSVSADDGIKSSSRAFGFHVRHDTAPIWDTSNSGPLVSQLGSTSVIIHVAAHDVNGKSITYSLAQSSTFPGTLSLSGNEISGILPDDLSETSHTYYFDLVANNGTLSTTKTFSVQTLKHLAPTWNTSAGNIVTQLEGASVSFSLSASSFLGLFPITYSLTSGSLPSGFTLSNAGLISGTLPSVDSDTTYTFEVTASDGSLSAAQTFTIVDENNVPPVWSTNAGVIYDDLSGIILNGGAGIDVHAYDVHGQSITYSLTNGTSLPSGLTLYNNHISGTMPVSNTIVTTDFEITANNGLLSTSRTFTIIAEANLPPVWVTNSNIGAFIEQTPMTFSLVATDPENQTIKYDLSGGSLPTGIGMGADGVLYGTTPAEVANTTFNFSVIANDGVNSTSRSFSMEVDNASPPVWPNANVVTILANAVENRAYTYTFSAPGATVYTVNSGSLPSGLTLHSNGVLSGSPSTVTTDTDFTFDIFASNGIRGNSKSYDLTVRLDAAPTWNTAAGEIANSLGNHPVNVQLSATERNALNVVYSLTNGTSLPSGITMASNGAIIGTMPVTYNAATYAFTVSANNGVFSASRNFSIHALAAAAPTWNTAGGSLGSGIEQTFFSTVLVGYDAQNEDLVFSVAPGSTLPGTLALGSTPGHSYDDAGQPIYGVENLTLSGTLPATATDHTYTFTLNLYDGFNTTSRDFSILVNHHYAPTWNTAAGQIASVYSGESFSYALSASSANSLPLTYTVNSGTLPSGISLSSDGTLHGTNPIDLTNTTYTFDVAVSDGTFTVVRTFTIQNKPNLAPVWVTSNASPLVSQFESTSVSTTVVATDPEGLGVTYALGSNNLPSSLGSSLFALNSSTGTLTGTMPSVVANTTYTFDIIAHDRQNVNSTTKTFQILNKFNQVPIWTTSAGSLVVGTENTTFSTTVVATAGGDALSYALAPGSNSLPSGVTLSNTGVLSGTFPTVTQDTTYSFTIRASDTAKYTDRDFSFTSYLQRPPVWSTPAGNLYTDWAGTTFTKSISASSPNGLPLTYEITSGSLPPNVTFDANALTISGTLQYVNSNTSYSFGIGAFDGSVEVSRTFTITNKYNPAPTWVSNSVPAAIENIAYSYQLAATNTYSGTVIYTLANSTTLPTGLTLSNTGLISGTIANVASTYVDNFVVSASNGYFANYVSLALTVNHDNGPVWVSGTTLSGLEQKAFSNTLVATNSLGLNVTYSNTTAMGNNLTLMSNGYVYGTLPSVTSNTTTNFTVLATDTAGKTASQTFAFTNIFDNPPVWTSNASLGTYFENSAVSIQLTATEALALPLTYTLNSGTLPSGLSLSNSGLLSGTTGTVVSNTTANFTVTASDGLKHTDQTFSFVTVYDPPPVFTTTSLPAQFEGFAYSQTVVATSQYSNPITYNFIGADTYASYVTILLPMTGTLNTVPALTGGTATNVTLLDGYLNGHLQSTGGFVENSVTKWGTQAVAFGGGQYGGYFKVSPATPMSGDFTIETWIYPTGDGVVLSNFIGPAASGGNSNPAQFIISLSSGNLVLQQATNAIISGSISYNQWHHIAWTRSGSTNTLWVDGASIGTSTAYTQTALSVYDVNSGSTTVYLYVGQWQYADNADTKFTGYLQDLRVTNSIARYTANFTPSTYSYAVTTPLPTGINFYSNGVINGTMPTVTANTAYTFVAQAYDGIKSTYQSLTINDKHISPPVWTTPAGSLGTVYDSLSVNTTVVATDTWGFPVTYSVTSGTLPSGVTLNANTGAITGTMPTISNSTATYNFTITANNGYKTSAEAFSLTENQYPPQWTTAANTILATVEEGLSLTANAVAATSIYGAVTYSSSNLPAGLSINANTGVITGTAPAFNGSPYTFAVVATDRYNNASASRNFQIATTQDVITWTESNLTPSGYASNAYSYQFTATGGEATLAYTVNAGSLPSSLSLSSAGLLSGTLSSTPGTSNYSIKVSDGYQSVVKAFTFTINSATPVWTTSAGSLGTLPNAGAVSIQVTATSPQSHTITYSVTSGALPSGVTLSSSGLISGTLPATSDITTYNFTITATDSVNSLTASQAFTLTESAPSTSYAASDTYWNNTLSLLHMDPPGGSVALISSGQNLTVANNSALNFGTNDFTIEGWFYVIGYRSAADGLFDMRNGTGSGSCMYINSSGTLFWQSNSANPAITGTTLPIGKWTHVAISRVSGSVRMFMNGTQAGSTVSDSTSYSLKSGPFMIGYQSSSTYNFYGNITNIRVVNGTGLYSSNFTPPTGNLTAVTNTALLLNAKTSGNMLLDESTNNFTVTNNGSSTYSYNSPYGLKESGNSSITWSSAGGVVTNNIVPSYGNGSLYFPGGTNSSTVYARSTTDTRYNLSGNTDFTVEFWANTNSFPVGGADCVWCLGQASGTNTTHNLDLFFTGSTSITGISINTYNSAGTAVISQGFTLANPIPLNSWHHYVMQRHNYTYYFFVDGQLVAEYYNSASLNYTAGDYAQLGSLFVTSYAYPFQGNIYEYRFTPGVARYTGNFSVPTADYPNVQGPLWATNPGLLGWSGAYYSNATISNVSVSAYENHLLNGSLLFNGSNQYLSASNNASLRFGTSDFTVEFWMYCVTAWTSMSSGPGIIGQRANDSAAGWQIYKNTGSNYMNARLVGSTDYPSTVIPSTGVWQHWALVRSGTTLTWYCNGVASGSYTGVSANITDTAGNLNIGLAQTWANSYFGNGYLAGIRVVNGTAVYTSNFTPSTTPLTAIANTTLLLAMASSANAIVDSSSSHITFTNNNSATWTANTTPFSYNDAMTYAITSGSLPSSLSMTTSGVINGSLATVTSDTSSVFTVTAYDANAGVMSNSSFSYDAISSGDPYFANVAALVRAKDAVSNATVWNYVKDFSTNNLPFYTTNSAVLGWETNAVAKFANTASLYFNGTNSTTVNANANISLGTSNFTIEGWVYVTSLSTTSSIYRGGIMAHTVPSNSGTGTSGYNWALYLTGSAGTTITGVAFEYGNGAATAAITASVSISVNAWHHVAVVKNGTTGTFFVDGIAVGSSTLPSSLPSIANSVLAIGGTPITSGLVQYGATLTGYIQEARLTIGTARYLTTNPGGYMSYNGTSYLTIAANTAVEVGANDFTLEAWVYPTVFTTATNGNNIFSKGATTSVGNDFFSFQINTGGVPQLYAGNFNGAGSAIIQANSAIPLNTWTHVAVTRTGTTHKMWINGTLSNTSTASYTITAGGNGYVGSQSYAPGNSTRSFSGNITNVRLVKNTTVYSSTFTPAPFLTAIANTSLLLVSNTSATATTDTSGNNLSVAATGATWVAGGPYIVPQAPFSAILDPSPVWTSSTAYGIQNATVTAFSNANSPAGHALTYTLVSGSLPSGLSLAANGALSGTLSVANTDVTSTFTVSATDPIYGLKSSNQTVTYTSYQYGDTYYSNVSLLVHGEDNTSLNGGSLTFNGSSQYATTTSSVAAFGTGDFTVEFWVYPNTTAWSGTYATIWNTNVNNGMWIGKLGGNFTIRASNVADIIDYGTLPPVNTWTHVAISRQGTTMRMFYNGTQVGTVTSSNNFPTGTSYLGQDGSGNYFNGYIANMRFVTGTSLYNANFTPSTAPLTAVTNTTLLLKSVSSANALVDSSTTNATFTNNGTAWSANNPFFFATQFKDYSVNALALTSTMVTSALPYPGSGSVSLNGSTQYLTVPKNAAFDFGAGDFTIETWLNLNNATQPAYSAIYAYRGPSGPSTPLLVDFDSTGIGLRVTIGGQSVSFGAHGQAAGKWFNVAVTRTSGSVRVFINGTQLGSTTSMTGSATQQSDYSLYIGANPAGIGTYNINAYLTNMRVSNSSLYTSNFTVATTPLSVGANTVLLLPIANNSVTTDLSTNNFTVTNNGTSTWSVQTPFIGSSPVATYANSSLYFNGANYFTVTPSTSVVFGTNNFTVEAWVYLTATPTINGPFIMDARDSSHTTGWYFGWTNGVAGQLAWMGGAATTANYVSTNAWHHVAYVRNGTTGTLYVDGANVASAADSTNYNVTPGTSYIGTRYNQASGSFFQGYMQELRITNGTARYTTNFPVPSTPFGDAYAPVPSFTTTAGTFGTYNQNSAVSIQIAATSPVSDPLTYSIASGSLPGGTTLNASTGLISGTMSSANGATFNFTVAATDSLNNLSATRAFSITNGDQYLANVSTLTLMTGTVGSQPTVAVGTTNTVTFYGTAPLISATQSKWGTTSTAFLGGGSGFMFVSNAPSISGDFTWEAWIYPTSVTDGIVLSTYPGASAGRLFYITSGSLVLYDASTAGTIMSGGTISANAWYHVALCRASGTTRIFINGVQAGASLSSDAFNYGSNSTKFGIGGYEYSPSNHQFTGYMDGVRVTNSVARYTSTFTPPIKPFPNS